MKTSTRKCHLMTWLMVAALSALAECTFGADANDKTNFVVILCDDLGYGDLSCFGNPVIRTPNLDRLARQGMRLTDCYAAAPVCSPARAGMLTGRTPYRCGIYDWIPEDSPMHLPASEVTVAKLLKSAGYATSFVGKWHCNGKFNSSEQPQPIDHGFDYWFATQNNALPSHKNPINFVRNGQEVGPLEGYSSTIIVNEAINWLQKRDGDRPFCLFVWFHSPHEPVATADEFAEKYKSEMPPERAIYYGNVAQMDHEAGRLLKTLDDLDLRKDTFVMFTSDNGPETLNRYRGASRSFGEPGPLRGMKLHMYEGGIRVPGIIRWPGKTSAGEVCRQAVCGTDVLPTLCAIAGAKVLADRPIDGANILPIFDNSPVNRKVPLYWQYDQAIGNLKLAMRQGDYKILADAGLSRFELYNLANDIGETNDLAASEPGRLKAMSATLKRMHDEIGKEGPKWPTFEMPGAKKAKR